MKRNYKVNMNTNILKHSSVGIVIGLGILFTLVGLGAMCIQNETIDISYKSVVTYFILFLCSLISNFITIKVFKDDSIYLVMIITTVFSLIYCCVTIALFETLNASTVTRIPTVYLGGLIAFFVTKALPEAKKPKKRRVRNW